MPAPNCLLSIAALAAFLSSAAPAQYLYLTNNQSGGTHGEILRFSARTGELVDHFITTENSPVADPYRLLIGPDGWLYVQDGLGILRFDLRTGASLGRFVSTDTLVAISIGPDGNLYAIESSGGYSIRKYDGATGAPLGFLVPAGTGNLGTATHLLFGPDGDLYVADGFGNHDVRRFDGKTGAFRGVFIPASATSRPVFLHFAPNGSLYVSESGKSIERHDAATGALLANLTAPFEFAPGGLATGPDGNLYAVDEEGRGVARFSESTNAYGGLIIASGAFGLAYPSGIVFGPCSTGLGSLCVNASRFRVVAHWRTPNGAMGIGTPVQLTADTGTFWFFDKNNVETVVKVLDGCGVNNRYWVFAGGLTNVFVRLDVTDTQTGATKSYTNPLGKAFAPIQDTAAFSSCPASH